jgi:hypothetical protein
MPLSTLRILGVSMLFVLTAACASSVAPGVSVRGTSVARTGNGNSGDTLPEPFGPQSPQSLLDSPIVRSNAPAPINLKTLRHGMSPFSSVHYPGDHEDAGVGFQDSGRYTSIYAVHTLYPTFNLAYPSGQSGNEYLFAPTTKAGCLENVTVYVNGGSGTQPQFSVFDWCNNGGYILVLNIDNTFVNKYVRKLSNGDTAYVTEVYTAASKPRAGTVWKSLIFNNLTGHWDTMKSLIQQNPPTYNGWSIFETYFLPGPCPTTPAIAATRIKQYDTVTKTWRLMTPTLPGLSTSVTTGPPGDCFVADSTGPATYRLKLISPDYSWKVHSRS